MPFIGKCEVCGYYFLGEHRRSVLYSLMAHFRIFKRRKHPAFSEDKVTVLRLSKEDYHFAQESVKKADKMFWKGLRGNLPLPS